MLHGEAPNRSVQLALIRAEFEALSPLLDSTGRLERLIAPLFLFEQGFLYRISTSASIWSDTGITTTNSF